MRQTIAALPINLFKSFLELAKLTMPFGCFVSLRSLSHSLLLLQPSFGQLLVSFMQLHSFRPSLRYITPCSQPDYLLQCNGTLTLTQSKAQVMHIPFRKPTLQCSLGSIPLNYVLHSFQSHSVHPLQNFTLVNTWSIVLFRNREFYKMI